MEKENHSFIDSSSTLNAKTPDSVCTIDAMTAAPLQPMSQEQEPLDMTPSMPSLDTDSMFAMEAFQENEENPISQDLTETTGDRQKVATIEAEQSGPSQEASIEVSHGNHDDAIREGTADPGLVKDCSEAPGAEAGVDQRGTALSSSDQGEGDDYGNANPAQKDVGDDTVSSEDNAMTSCEEDGLQEPSVEHAEVPRGQTSRQDSTSTNVSSNRSGSPTMSYSLPPPSTHPRTISHAASSRAWESDKQVTECRRCNRRFNFLVRRHHCRRCGQIVCDRCSTHRVRLPIDEVIKDPDVSASDHQISAMSPQRVCDACIRVPIKVTKNISRHDTSRAEAMGMRRTDSQQSILTECPVCGFCLLRMNKERQERHLQQCLNTGSPPVRPPPRYIVYHLSDNSPQLGVECPICFEEFAAENKVARMECLCSYHERCLRDWLERGKGCPVHYDTSLA